jgi:hypothetical protein
MNSDAFAHYEILRYQSLTEDNIRLLLRTLSACVPAVDIHELYLHSQCEHKEETCPKKTIKKKAKDRIIEENIARRLQQLEEIDAQLLKTITKLPCEDTRYALDRCSHFKTDMGITLYKKHMIDLLWERKEYNIAIELYLQCTESPLYQSNEQKHAIRMSKRFEKHVGMNTSPAHYQLKYLSNALKPLDLYNKHRIILDPWQIKVVDNIRALRTTIVSAPTSCGKTWLACYPACKEMNEYNVLYVVPTEALAFQIAATLVASNESSRALPHMIVPSVPLQDALKTSSRLWVGTIQELHMLLLLSPDVFARNKIKLDYIVYDEVHTIYHTVKNKTINRHPELGESYKFVLKSFATIPFLALSATLASPEQAVTDLASYTKIDIKDIDIIHHSDRFINMTRHVIVDESIVQVYPLAYLKDANSSMSNAIGSVGLTPADTLLLYTCLSKIWPDDERLQSEYSPQTFFSGAESRLLSLNEVADYERKLKFLLLETSQESSKILEVMHTVFGQGLSSPRSDDVKGFASRLLKSVGMSREFMPCLVFTYASYETVSLFEEIVSQLATREEEVMPFYRENIEYLQTIHENFVKTYEEERASIAKDIHDTKKSGSNGPSLEARLLDFKLGAHSAFQLAWQRRFMKQSKELHEHGNTIALSALETEYNRIRDTFHPENPVDIYQKHPDFCCSPKGISVSADTIREIRRRLCLATQSNVDYNNIYIQGLKRGIGIYSVLTPSAYNLEVQLMAQRGMLGIVISDNSLALGINMPFRSTCILGRLTPDSDSVMTHLDYTQMIGRSGRRGLDREGHVIHLGLSNLEIANLMFSSHIDSVQDIPLLKSEIDVNVKIDTITDTLCACLEAIGSTSTSNWMRREDGLNKLNIICSQFTNVDQASTRAIFLLLSFAMYGNDPNDIDKDRDVATYIDKCFAMQSISPSSLHHCFFEMVEVLRVIHNVLITNPRFEYYQIVRHIAYAFHLSCQLMYKANILK